ncbi:MAG: UDP-3-O-acyl-N-acetylglucosamine deacetylase [Nitrospinales bacterium]
MPKERILIVDDEKNIVSSLESILFDEGYEVSSAEDGLDALEIIQSDPPDLVLLDIWIPGMDGIEVLKTIKAYNPETHVLIMSGHASIDTAVKATKLGASDFIEKPFSLNQLVQSVENVLLEEKARPLTNDMDFSSKLDILLSFEMMLEVKKRIKQASRNNKPVLLLGEKGTGKELIAQAIHHQSRKGDRPFVKLNCAVRPIQEIQAQLVVALKNGSPSRRFPGRQAVVGQKAVYLSRVEFLSKTVQEMLVQALRHEAARQDKSFAFLPTRLFASSTKDLRELVQKGQFSRDLWETLQDTAIKVPPLREHAREIPGLVHSYFQASAKKGQDIRIDEEVMQALCHYDWPENVKELRSVLKQLLITSSSRDTITLQYLPPAIRRAQAQAGSVRSPGHAHEKNAARRIMQRTLRRSMVLCGSGLHSGIKTGLILQPLPPGSGIIFGDISSGDTVAARLENVQSTDYSTCLKKGFTSVATVEHIMAVLHMYRITNLLIKIGDEAPVMDGSAKDFCQLIEDGEFEEQDEPYEEIVIDKPYSYGSKDNGGAYISIEPAERFAASYHMEYPEPIGVQDYNYEFAGEESFKKQIAPARTFGFLKDMAELTKMGFASGGKLDNCILLDDKKVLNTELRFEDEFARHKILDIIGDFYLLGKPIRGFIKAHKSGHKENIALLKKIQASSLSRV